MATIIQRNSENPLIYHGIVTAKYENYFIFGMRVNGKNISFECHYDFWRLIEE